MPAVMAQVALKAQVIAAVAGSYQCSFPCPSQPVCVPGTVTLCQPSSCICLAASLLLLQPAWSKQGQTAPREQAADILLHRAGKSPNWVRTEQLEGFYCTFSNALYRGKGMPNTGAGRHGISVCAWQMLVPSGWVLRPDVHENRSGNSGHTPMNPYNMAL